ncbi:MAG: ZIP family metal transporter [Candidatus Saccharimonadales bacterium]
MDLLWMWSAIIVGSSISLLGGALIFTTKRRREQAILVAMPFGAGALLSAAFLDLLPEALDLTAGFEVMFWTLAGFLFFFVLERSAGWFHHHHQHNQVAVNTSQRWLIVIGDLMHNAIDGVAIGAAFLANPALGIITTIAVSAHEIPKELGTFALLLSRGWKDRTVLLANVATAVATLITATSVYLIGNHDDKLLGALLASTAGFFIYIAASDIIPDIHEQPQKVGMIQAAALVIGVILVGIVITFLGV